MCDACPRALPEAPATWSAPSATSPRLLQPTDVPGRPRFQIFSLFKNDATQSKRLQRINLLSINLDAYQNMLIASLKWREQWRAPPSQGLRPPSRIAGDSIPGLASSQPYQRQPGSGARYRSHQGERVVGLNRGCDKLESGINWQLDLGFGLVPTHMRCKPWPLITHSTKQTVRTAWQSGSRSPDADALRADRP